MILFSRRLKCLKVSGGNDMRKRYAAILVFFSILMISTGFVDAVEADMSSTISFTVMPGGVALTATPELNFDSADKKEPKKILNSAGRSNILKVAQGAKDELTVEDYRGSGATPWQVYAQLSLRSAGVIHSETESYDRASGQTVHQMLSVSREPNSVMNGSAKVGIKITKLANSRLDVRHNTSSMKEHQGIVTWTLTNTAAN